MIGIVGAGITGLTVHHYLSQNGIESLVFEAADEPGGVIQTVYRDGRLLDCGPQRTRLTPSVRKLVDTVGLGNRIIEAADVPLFVHYRGRLRRAPRSFREAVITDLLSWRGKLRVLLEPLAGPPREGETVTDYLTRVFGHEFATRLGGPLYAGLYASNPEEMPVEHSLKRALDRFGIKRSVLLKLLRTRLNGRSPPPMVSFNDGMQEFPRALYENHSETVRLNAPIRAIHEAANGYELVTDNATMAVDEVVITTQAPTSAPLLEEVDPKSAAGLRDLTYNPLVVVHLQANVPLVGAGHHMPFSEPFVTLGVTWNNSLFTGNDPSQLTDGRDISSSLRRDGIYTCYLGGAKTPEAVKWSEERLGNIAATEFEKTTGFPAEPLYVHRFSPGMPAYDQSWDALNRVALPTGIHLCASYESRAGIPGRVRHGKQHAAVISEST